MANTKFKLDTNSKLTKKDIEIINKAKSSGYDPECPPLTPEFLSHCTVVRYKNGKKQIEAIIASDLGGSNE